MGVGIPIYYVMGGASDGDLFALASTDANRAVFVQRMIDRMLLYDYDGIGLDQEREIDHADYQKVVEDLRAAMDNIIPYRHYHLSVSISLWMMTPAQAYAMVPYVDSFDLMTYWSNIMTEAQEYIDYGIPSDMIEGGIGVVESESPPEWDSSEARALFKADEIRNNNLKAAKVWNIQGVEYNLLTRVTKSYAQDIRNALKPLRDEGYWVAGEYVRWEYSDFPPDQIDFSTYTHIYDFNVKMRDDLTIYGRSDGGYSDAEISTSLVNAAHSVITEDPSDEVPAAENPSVEDPVYSFTFTADMREWTSNFETVLQDINDEGGMGAFHIFLGDWDHDVSDSTNRDKIDEYFADSDNPEPILFPIIGNHEINGHSATTMDWLRNEYNNGNGVRTPLRDYTNEDGPTGIKESQYSWDAGGVRFIALNIYANDTNTDDDFTDNGRITPANLIWLEGVLQDADSSGLQKIVMTHEPAFDPDWSRKDGECLDIDETTRDQFCQMMEDYGVLAYLCGDTHIFKTFIPSDVVDSTGDFPHESGGDANFLPNKTPHIDIGNAGNDETDGYSWGRGDVYSDRVVFSHRRDPGKTGTFEDAADSTYSTSSYTLFFRGTDSNPSASNPSDENLCVNYSPVLGIGSDAPSSTPVDVDGIFAESGSRYGIIGNSTNITVVLNETTPEGPGSPTASYPAKSFGNAEYGELILELNEVEIVSIDLTASDSGGSFYEQDTTSGSSTSGLHVSEALPVRFPDGSPFERFKYRTGTAFIHQDQMRNGWNYVKVIHRIDEVDAVTNYIDWVRDCDETYTTYSGEYLTVLSMNAGSTEFLSGVEYYTEGAALFKATIHNAYRNTYSSSSSAVRFIESGVAAMSNEAFANCSADGYENKLYKVDNDSDNKLVNINTSGIRLLNESVSVQIVSDRTVQGTFSGTEAISEGLLVDGLIDHTATADSSENFNGEGYRLPSNLDINSIDYDSGAQKGPVIWNPQESIANYFPDNPSYEGAEGYNDGLLVYDGTLRYPTQGINGGDFRYLLEGGIIDYSPLNNVDYSTPNATGDRSFLCYFINPSSTHQNFNFDIDVSAGTTFREASLGPTANILTCEVLAPNETKNGSTVEFKDMMVSYDGDDNNIGAYASTYGGGRPSNWGVTIGTKTTANSGNAIVIRITASQSWTGFIYSIQCNFL